MGDDFDGASVTFTFEGKGQQCADIPVVMDERLESGEKFIAVLRPPIHISLGSQSTAIIKIMDSDGMESCIHV